MQTIEPLIVDFHGVESRVSLLWVDAPDGEDRKHRVAGLTAQVAGEPDSFIVVSRSNEGQWRDATYEMTAEQMVTWTSHRRGEHSRPLCDWRLAEWLNTHTGKCMADVRHCRVCGCTDDRACEGGCWWVGADLCSTCRAAGR